VEVIQLLPQARQGSDAPLKRSAALLLTCGSGPWPTLSQAALTWVAHMEFFPEAWTDWCFQRWQDWLLSTFPSTGKPCWPCQLPWAQT
jgi:hypothetical protein